MPMLPLRRNMCRSWNTSRDQAERLAAVECAVLVGLDAGGVLAAVLQYRQRVIDRLVDRTMGDDADDATHGNQLLRTNGPAARFRLRGTRQRPGPVRVPAPQRRAARQPREPHTVSVSTAATKVHR